jgi:hypothetical protein
VRLLSRSSYDSPTVVTKVVEKFINKFLPNPNPGNYEIVKSAEKGGYLIVLINYKDCTNYEGNKILVYKDVSFQSLLDQKKIDPHFSENTDYYSPIARFVPTEEGWDLAELLVDTLYDMQA